MISRFVRGRGFTLLVLGALLVTAPAALAFDPEVEGKNFSKGQERQAIYDTPEYQALLRQVSLQNRAAALTMQASDPERNFSTHVCASGEDGCAGDARLYDWAPKGYGIVKPVLFTARSGATVSGHVWATRSGPAKRPGIVITNGSVQAAEQLYWFAAQTLAKAGYVVLTSDPQGQGQSDEQGEVPDQSEGSPAQTDGRPFFDGTVDALNFFLSKPSSPYQPVKSCNSGTSHAAKQTRRVAAGQNAAYNPLWDLVDSSRIGLAGHSYGAAGVSYVGQSDPRVKATVAWDNLATPDPNQPFGGNGGNPVEKPCPGDPSARAVARIAKPALGMSADYFIPPQPNTSDPDPLAKSKVSRDYTAAGVDTGEIVIRGGTHYDFDWIPNHGFPATLRGADEITWYTTAWFDKYVKGGDSSADSRLLTNRWIADKAEAAVDPDNDGNMFSFYYRSRLDIDLAGGGHFRNEDMRAGRGLAPDCQPASYAYIDIVKSPDGPRANASCPVALAGSGSRCIAKHAAVSGRRIGPARLGRGLKAFFKRHRAVRRSRRVTRFCVRGGGRFLVGAHRGKIDLVATTARSHRTRRTGPGRRVRGASIAGTRKLGRGLLVGHRVGRGRVVYGVRRHRVRFLAAVSRGQVAHRRKLVRRLRAVGLTSTKK